jgi:methyltransferase family protein
LAQFPEHDAHALTVVAGRASCPGMVAVELGSWCGHSSSIIAKVVKEAGGIVYCVDRWDVYPDDPVDEPNTLSQIFITTDVLRVFRDNMIALGLADVVVPIVASSTQAVSLIADACVDLVFIDADHRYSCVKQDIVNFWPKLKIGGTLCGHDYDKWTAIDEKELVEFSEVDTHGGHHCGVIRAVDELFGPTVRWPGTSTVWSVKKARHSLGIERNAASGPPIHTSAPTPSKKEDTR